jgi:quinol monooxygenase YgiN
MVFCFYTFKASRSNVKNIDDILGTVVQPTRFYLGCISSNIWYDKNNSNVLLLLEMWETIELLKAHLASTLYRKVLQAMELCSEKPDVRFVESSTVRSLNWIEHVLISEIAD